MTDLRVIFVFCTDRSLKKLDCVSWIFRCKRGDTNWLELSAGDINNKPSPCFEGKRDIRLGAEAERIWSYCMKEGLISEEEDVSKRFGLPVGLELELVAAS